MFVSIITVNRNNAEGLEKTIRSVIEQEKQLFEYIIIDGASTDNSMEIIEKYRDNIDFYISEPDKGVYNAMNKSLKYAKGDYILFMNSGDEFASTDVLKQIAKFHSNEDIILAGWNRTKHNKILETSFPNKNITLHELYFHSFCCHQATFTRTKVLKELNGYDENIRISADACFLMKALIEHRKTCKIVPIVCCNYDITGMSGQSGSETTIRKEKAAFFKEHFPYMVTDYKELHKYMRLKPLYIYRFIKWRFFGNKH